MIHLFENIDSVRSNIRPEARIQGVITEGGAAPNVVPDRALAEIGHHGFSVDAQAMTALLYDFATRADYRVAVKREFDGIKALFDEYVAALEKTYKNPIVK